MNSNTDSAYKYANTLYLLGIQHKDTLAIIDGIDAVANTFMSKGQYKIALEYFSELPKECEIPPAIESKILSSIGVCYKKLDDLKTGLQYYKKALKVEYDNNIELAQGKILGNMGILYDQLGKYEKAIDCHFKALKIKESLHDSVGISYSYLNLGIVYADLNNFEKANECMEKAIYMAKSTNNYGLLVNAYLNAFGLNYTSDADKALKYLKEAEKMALNMGNDRLLSGIAKSYGQYYSQIKNYKEALESYNIALELDLKSNDRNGVAICYMDIGKIYYETGNLDQCLKAYNNSLERFKTIDNLYSRKTLHKLLYEVYSEKLNYEKALNNYILFTNLNDSINNTENRESLLKRELKFEYEKKAAVDSIMAAEAAKLQTALLDAEKAKSTKRTQQNYFLIVGLAIALIFGLVLYNRNRITKKQNQIIAKQKEQLAELDIIKNDFFTNITHEFRTPLTVILGAAGNIENSNDVELIKRNGQRLLKLINQILELSKLEDGSLGINKRQIDAVAFTKYLTDSYKSLAMSQNKSLEFISKVPEQFMDLDEDKYQTIIGNLVSNAVKFTPENGAIQIDANSNGQRLEISIKDSGDGIPEEELDRLFDRFYQVKGSKSQKIGSGVGLALTKELVLRFGGSIAVKNHAKGGAVFTVTLPITQQAPKTDFKATGKSEANSPTQQIEAEVEKNDEKPILLLVEDEPDIQSFIKATLANDYNIIIANNGDEGVNMALEQVPDIILSDVMMPVKDGLELTDELKNDARTSHIPIALLTAKVDLESRLEGLKRGADVYLPKPFEKEELLLQLSNLQEQQKRVRAHFGSVETTKENNPVVDEAIEIEDEFITKLKETIASNFENESFGIEELSKAIGMSRTQLHRKLKALTGKSASQFVNEFKIEKACELLLEPENNVSEVAYALGFSDPNYFTRVFTKIKSQSPTEFLEQNRNS
jgi:signal transduction histidine kinase/DNA-binding response OmpR family regulator